MKRLIVPARRPPFFEVVSFQQQGPTAASREEWLRVHYPQTAWEPEQISPPPLAARLLAYLAEGGLFAVAIFLLWQAFAEVFL